MNRTSTWERGALIALLCLEVWAFSGAFNKFFNLDGLFYIVDSPKTVLELARCFAGAFLLFIMALLTDVLQSLALKSDGFEIHVEMFAQMERKGFSIREILLRFIHQNESGEVSVLRFAPRMFFGSLRIWRSLRSA